MVGGEGRRQAQWGTRSCSAPAATKAGADGSSGARASLASVNSQALPPAAKRPAEAAGASNSACCGAHTLAALSTRGCMPTAQHSTAQRSVLTVRSRSPYSAEISSTSGAIMRQGPHQGAQKSTWQGGGGMGNKTRQRGEVQGVAGWSGHMAAWRPCCRRRSHTAGGLCCPVLTTSATACLQLGWPVLAMTQLPSNSCCQCDLIGGKHRQRGVPPADVLAGAGAAALCCAADRASMPCPANPLPILRHWHQ